jgi:crossover junction endodeoxyribonuclease RusA
MDGPELDLPLAFTIAGVPLSVQASSKSKSRWRAEVQAALRLQLPGGHWAVTGRLRVGIVAFSVGRSALDVDNIAKPILDALTHLVWLDDRQVDELVVRKTELSEITTLRGASPELLASLATRRPFVLVRVSSDIAHEELP